MSHSDTERCKTCLGWPEEHNDEQKEICRNLLDRVTVKANGLILLERVGWVALSLAKFYRGMFTIEATAHMPYTQRIMGDWSGALKMNLLTNLETAATDPIRFDPIRFSLCGCLVYEDNMMPDDVVEFRDTRHPGRVLARITNLCTTLPRIQE